MHRDFFVCNKTLSGCKIIISKQQVSLECQSIKIEAVVCVNPTKEVNMNEWSWLERDYGDFEKPPTTRELELEEQIEESIEMLQDLLDFLAEEKTTYDDHDKTALSIMIYSLAKKLNFKVEHDIIPKIWNTHYDRKYKIFYERHYQSDTTK